MNTKIIPKEATSLVRRPYPHEEYVAVVFLSILGYIVNSRPTWASVSDPVSSKTNRQNKTNKQTTKNSMIFSPISYVDSAVFSVGQCYLT